MAQRKKKSNKSYSLELYFHDIVHSQPLTPEEEIRLTKLVREKSDTDALNKLINANLKFVVSVAKKYLVPGVTLEDLISEGNIGLIKAAHRFDETRGFKFISYAVWWIRQSILQYISEQGRIVRIPANISGGVTRMKKYSVELEQTYEREPTLDELADVLEITLKEAENLIRHNIKSISVDQPIKDSNDASIRDILVAEDNRPEAKMMRESLISEIERVLGTIPKREAKVIKYYFGIGYDRQLTLEEIGKKVQLTRERVRQIKERAIQRLRHNTRAHLLRTFLG